MVHYDLSYDLAGFAGYLPSLDAKVLVFRGTKASSWTNWVENMRAYPVRADAAYPVPGAPHDLRIHSGFLVLWNSSSMAATFLEAYRQLATAHPRGPTYVIGHSMGGALAHLAALDLRAAFDPDDLQVFTFGSPRVGNAAFAAFFGASVDAAWRFTHARDAVPSLPPLLMGFHHSAREVWLVDEPPTAATAAAAAWGMDGAGSGGAQGRGGSGSSFGLQSSDGKGSAQWRRRRKLWEAASGSAAAAAAADPLPPLDERIIVCDESGEDPSCHNSACHLGLCTSVADHYVYLDTHMYADADECA